MGRVCAGGSKNRPESRKMTKQTAPALLTIPSYAAREAAVLPLNYARILNDLRQFQKSLCLFSVSRMQSA